MANYKLKYTGEQIDALLDKVASGEVGGGPTKYIILEIQKPIIFDGSGGTPEMTSKSWHNLRIRLINFTEDDIGSYIYLFRYGRHKRHLDRKIQHFVHPTNWDNETISNVERMGFGAVAGMKYYRDVLGNVYRYCELPDWMPKNGFVQTEFLITREHIEQGYMEIDVGVDFVCLLRPHCNVTDGESKDFDDDNIGYLNNGMYITYMQVKNNKVLCVSTNMLSIKRNHSPDVEGYLYEVVYFDDFNIPHLKTSSTRIQLKAF